MSTPETYVTNAKNVLCRAVGKYLTFSIDLSQRVSQAELGLVKEGRVFLQHGREELPYTASLKLMNVGAAIHPAKTLDALRQYTESHVLVEGDASVHWTLKGENAVCIKVDCSSFPEKVAHSPTGGTVKLLRLNTSMSQLLRVELNITCPGQATFPSSYLKRISNPELSDASSHADDLTADESGEDALVRLSSDPDGGSARASVARQLRMGSVTSESVPGGGPTFGGIAFSQSPGRVRGVVALDEALTVDTVQRQQIRLLFYPEKYDGNLFKRDFSLLGDVGVQLTIEIADEDDPRVVPKKEPKRPVSHSFSLHNAGKAGNRRAQQKAVNVTVDLEDSVRTEKCLVISFNGDETHEAVDMERLLVESGYSGSKMGVGIGGDQGSSLTVANCSNFVKANYIVNLSVVRVVIPIPTEREVYIAVNSFFCQRGYVAEEDQDGPDDSADNTDKAVFFIGNDAALSKRQQQQQQYTLSMLQTLDMKEVEEYLSQVYDCFIRRATQGERQTFSFLVWSCTRDCIINKVLHREEPLLDGVDGFVLDMLQG